jgi:hypothetical protein
MMALQDGRSRRNPAGGGDQGLDAKAQAECGGNGGDAALTIIDAHHAVGSAMRFAEPGYHDVGAWPRVTDDLQHNVTAGTGLAAGVL